jgi:hypothetical protein
MERIVTIACEGLLDHEVLARLLAAHDLAVGPVYNTGGKRRLDQRLPGYTNAARFSPWIVQRDLDNDASCAPALVRRLVPDLPPGLCLILAVRQVEAWLLADRPAIATFLRVADGAIPDRPETLPNAKSALIDIARQSRSRGVREGMVPVLDSGRTVGIAYTATMQAFVQTRWDFRRARLVAPSLATLVARLQRFGRVGRWHERQVQ